MSGRTRPMVERLAWRVDETAASLGVDPSTVYRWMQHRHDPLPSILVGGRRMVIIEDLKAWLKRQGDRV